MSVKARTDAWRRRRKYVGRPPVFMNPPAASENPASLITLGSEDSASSEYPPSQEGH